MFAFSIDYDGFEADFVQTVKNKSGKKIEYYGKLKAKKPDKGVWEYSKPVKKTVFVNGDSVIVYEPLLSQAKYLKKRNSISLDAILKNAKQNNDGTFSTKDGDITYNFSVSSGMVEKLWYKEAMDNDVTIAFDDRKKNQSIPNSTFEFKPSAEIDIIK